MFDALARYILAWIVSQIAGAMFMSYGLANEERYWGFPAAFRMVVGDFGALLLVVPDFLIAVWAVVGVVSAIVSWLTERPYLAVIAGAVVLLILAFSIGWALRQPHAPEEKGEI